MLEHRVVVRLMLLQCSGCCCDGVAVVLDPSATARGRTEVNRLPVQKLTLAAVATPAVLQAAPNIAPPSQGLCVTVPCFLFAGTRTLAPLVRAHPRRS